MDNYHPKEIISTLRKNIVPIVDEKKKNECLNAWRFLRRFLPVRDDNNRHSV